MRYVIVEPCEPGFSYRVKVTMRSIYLIHVWKEIKDWLRERNIVHMGVLECIYFAEEEDAAIFLLAWEHRL